MDNRQCKICGRKAVYSYYGVLACCACKVFFRRNAQNGLEKLKCKWENNCEINENNVHVCSYCRLKKCFTVGMKIEMLRASITRRTKTTQNLSFGQIPILNLLRSDISTLTVDEWTEISNISHCYDEYSGFQLSEQYMKQQYILPAKFRFKSDSFIKNCQDRCQLVQLLYLNNKDFLSLTSYDRSLLLKNTIQHVSSISANFISTKIGLTDCPVFFDTVAIIANPKHVPIVKLLTKQYNFDALIMKILLCIYCFSTVSYTSYSNSSPVNLTNLKQVLEIQNKYIELLWKYLLYRLGYKETVKALSDILRCLFSVNETIVLAQVDRCQWFADSIDSIVQLTEQTFINHK